MALNELGNAFYNIGNYQYATMVYQHLTDQSNLFNFEDEKTTAYQHIFYYRLGIMTLKQNDYFTARQHFISAFSALNKNKTIIDKIFFNQNWMTASVINHRIGECYYKETNYENAIKYYKEAHKAESNNEEKMKLLNQIAYSEYLNGQSDSSTVHFQQVEKYYNENKLNYKDGTSSYYVDWPLYLYHKSKDNTTKAQQYLTDAYNHISEDERNEYLEDDNRLANLHQYYYIHEIIETYNQNIR
jgi:tetratricopeptide (TPR) repeat protein